MNESRSFYIFSPLENMHLNYWTQSMIADIFLIISLYPYLSIIHHTSNLFSANNFTVWKL